MKGYIYQIINKVDGRRYIGQTINLEKRKWVHFLAKWKEPLCL